MRHHNVKRKFGRVRRVRTALMKSLARSLVIAEKIKTTEAKAKELRPYVEKLVTLGKVNTPAHRRILASRLGEDSEAKKIVELLSPRYKDRKGGYTRIVKLGRRTSDGSPMAHIEFV